MLRPAAAGKAMRRIRYDALRTGGRLLLPLLVLASAAAVAAEKQKPVVVGSKKFTESVILADAVAGLVQASGTPAVHRRELGGTRILWNALLAGEIDAYPEYTGTITGEILSSAAPSTSDPRRD